LDCIAICTVLGLAVDDKQIGKLCRKYGLSAGKDPLDSAYGFYLLHGACHNKGGMVSKRLTKLLDERFAGIIREVRQADCGNRVKRGNDREIAAKLKSWTRNCPAGAIWALLTDPRERLHQHGVYLVHKVAYAAFRDAQQKAAAMETDDNSLATVKRELRLSRKHSARHRTEAEELRGRLAEAERNVAALQRTCRQKDQRISELEGTHDEENRLRRHVRKLEYELARLRQNRSPAPAQTCDKANGKEEPPKEPPDVRAASCSRTGGDRRLANPAAPPEANCSPCPLDSLRVAVIGGLDRLEPRYRDVVESLGAEFLFHNGDCHARCRILKNVVCQSDIIVFITRVNSHSSLRVVRGLCRKTGKRFAAIRETSPQALTKVLQEVA
jgi:hypothetical protein